MNKHNVHNEVYNIVCSGRVKPKKFDNSYMAHQEHDNIYSLQEYSMILIALRAHQMSHYHLNTELIVYCMY